MSRRCQLRNSYSGDSKMAKSVASVLLPTCNRARILHRVYCSLNRQKARIFKCVVVGDGSIDDTQAVGRPRLWQTKADFPITWFRQIGNNRRKLSAISAGRKLLSGDYNLMLESEDVLVDDAVAIVAAWRTTTEMDSMPNIRELVVRCVDEAGRIVGEL